MELNDKFKEWACSFSGCDGGNMNAGIWICGIKWGNTDADKTKYYEKDLPEEIAKGTYSPPNNTYPWEETLRYPYGRNVAKLCAAIQGINVGEYDTLIKRLNGSEIFKMNLYPIAFNNTDDQLWKQHKLDKQTGFEEKYLFKAWCFLNRFPAISKELRNMPKPPKLIIGTGITYLTDFLACFAGVNGIESNLNIGHLDAASKNNQTIKRTYYWAKLKKGTTLVVIPFFSGAYGLNSNDLIQEIGKRIKQL